MNSMAPTCELCSLDGGEVLLRTGQWRIVLAPDERYPGFCRVIWNAHAKEMTDLSTGDRQRLMAVVWEVEAAVREVMQPHKVNVASLGNVVPHLHWHVIPRYADDAHFPDPIWAAARREPAAAARSERAAKVAQLRMTIRQRAGMLD